MNQARARLATVRRVVVKVGSSTITHENGRLHFARLERLCRAVADLMNDGRQVILVTSGAIATGTGKLGLDAPPNEIGAKQALAAIGQGTLMGTYERLMGECGLTIAQVLLTRDDLRAATRRQNCLRTLLRLLEWRVLPVVNENDTVATEEIKFGDNDTLSALVAELVGADLLVILTDTDGLYTADPRGAAEARRVDVVPAVTPQIEAYARGAGTARGVGGMVTKLQAAKIASAAGAATVVAPGADPTVLNRIVAGQPIGTLFLAAPARAGTGSLT